MFDSFSTKVLSLWPHIHGGNVCFNDSYEHRLQGLLLHWEYRIKHEWIYYASLSPSRFWREKNTQHFSFGTLCNQSSVTPEV